MKKGKWFWPTDQWFEDKVWPKVPEQYSTPHFFFLIGFGAGAILVFILTAIFK